MTYRWSIGWIKKVYLIRNIFDKLCKFNFPPWNFCSTQYQWILILAVTYFCSNMFNYTIINTCLFYSTSLKSMWWYQGIIIILCSCHFTVRTTTSETTAFSVAMAAGIACGAWQLDKMTPPTSDWSFNPIIAVEGWYDNWIISISTYHNFIERQKILARWEDAVKWCNATTDQL